MEQSLVGAARGRSAARHATRGRRLDCTSSILRRYGPARGRGMISELGQRGVPLQRRPVVGVEAGGPGLGAPTAAQEQALMTRDVLDRLLATCSPTGWRTSATVRSASAPIDPTSPTLRCLAIQLGAQGQCPRRGGEGATCGRVARLARVGPGLRAIDPAGGRESVSAAVDQPHSQAAVRADWTGCDGVCRTWSEIGVLPAAAGASRCPGRCNSGSVPVQQVPGYKSEADPGRVKASRLTL